MIASIFNIQQDTVSHRIINNQIPAQENSMSGTSHILQKRDSVRHRPVINQAVAIDMSDTISVCSRNSIADVTFHNFNNFILRIGQGTYKQFPYVLIEKAMKQQAVEKTMLLKSLKQGTDLPPQPLHADWIILIVIIAAALFAAVKESAGSLSSSVSRFVSFRNSNEAGSREAGGLFYWQSTILNLISFFIIALFGYSAASYYNLIPSQLGGIIPWFAVLLIISLAVALRHFTCIITGAASGKPDVFREYLVGVYQAYRLCALFLFAIVIMISYTRILPVSILVILGLIILGLMYLFRVFRLLIIFLNRNISIFYLILYLCALEILPVLIVAKFFTGLA